MSAFRCDFAEKMGAQKLQFGNPFREFLYGLYAIPLSGQMADMSVFCPPERHLVAICRRKNGRVDYLNMSQTHGRGSGDNNQNRKGDDEKINDEMCPLYF